MTRFCDANELEEAYLKMALPESVLFSGLFDCDLGDDGSAPFEIADSSSLKKRLVLPNLG
jgi:hypothetical protein